jgi:hypothetical protein
MGCLAAVVHGEDALRLNATVPLKQFADFVGGQGYQVGFGLVAGALFSWCLG